MRASLLRLPILFAVLLLVPLSGCGKPPYENLDNAGLKALLAQGVPIYDIRRPEEWRQTGVVEGSRTLTWVDGSGRPNPGFMTAFSAEVPKDQPVIVICRTGNRTSSLAHELMTRHGYTRVYNVKDGIVRWIGEGNPVARN